MNDRTRLRLSLAAIICSIAVVGFATGLTIPMLSLRLHAQGINEFIIGAFAAGPALGMVVSAPLVRPLFSRVGRKRAILASILVSGVSIGLITPDARLGYLWLLRFTMGAAVGVIVSIGESWINELANDDRRGRVVALYTSTFTVCQFFGPTVIAALGPDDSGPLILVGLLHLLTALALLMINESAPARALQATIEPALSMIGFIRNYPALCGGILFFSFFDGTVLALFPIYGIRHGYATASAALMVGVILAGDAFLQFPIGWLSDHMNRRHLYRYCGILTLVLSLSIPLAIGLTWLIWPILALLGAVAGGIYTLAIVQIGQHFRDRDLVTVNAAASVLWGLGSLVGPLLTGGAEMLGSGALPFALALAAGGFLVSQLGGECRRA